MEKFECKLCKQLFDYQDLSEEHYPARSVGNDDIVYLDFVKMMDLLMNPDDNTLADNVSDKRDKDRWLTESSLEKKLLISKYPKGRTIRSLCRKCNTFIGKYDEAYLKFFNANGECKAIKGFQKKTKINIVKAIYSKFISILEAKDEQFDYLDYIRNKNMTEYFGEWKIYFVRRNLSSDILGLNDIGTGVLHYDHGTVYELSDDKFIFNLMNFEKEDIFPMTNLFDILKDKYDVVEGVGENGGYHAQMLISRLFKSE